MRWSSLGDLKTSMPYEMPHRELAASYVVPCNYPRNHVRPSLPNSYQNYPSVPPISTL